MNLFLNNQPPKHCKKFALNGWYARNAMSMFKIPWYPISEVYSSELLETVFKCLYEGECNC